METSDIEIRAWVLGYCQVFGIAPGGLPDLTGKTLAERKSLAENGDYQWPVILQEVHQKVLDNKAGWRGWKDKYEAAIDTLNEIYNHTTDLRSLLRTISDTETVDKAVIMRKLAENPLTKVGDLCSDC